MNIYGIIIFAAIIYNVRCDEIGGDDVTDNDIIELCADCSDVTACLRSFFAENANCDVVEDVDSDPVYVPGTLVTYMPRSNTTVYLKGNYFTGLDGIVEAAYIDQTTQNLVLSVHLEAAQINTKEAVLYINQRSKQPKKVADYARGIHNIILTAVIPVDKQITGHVLHKSTVWAYFPEEFAIDFVFGPKVTKSNDPVIAAVAQTQAAYTSAIIQELFLTGASNFFQAYLEKNICKFGFPNKNVYQPR